MHAIIIWVLIFVTEYMVYLGGVEPTTCENGAIRLAGKSSNRGRVEICQRNVWRSVCHLSRQDARVICRTLGFSGVGEIMSVMSYVFLIRS